MCSNDVLRDRLRHTWDVVLVDAMLCELCVRQLDGHRDLVRRAMREQLTVREWVLRPAE